MIICTEFDKEFDNYKSDVKNKKVRFHIKQIFKDHWDDYKIKFASRKRRPIIDKVIDKFLLCKSYNLGYSLYECPTCHEQKVVPHTCKTRFVKIDFFSYASFRKRFMKVLLDLMEHELGKDEFKKLKNELYLNLKDGFYVYAPKSKHKSLKNLLQYVCRYLSRPVMAESRIIDYDGNYVTFWYQRHKDDIIVVEKLHVYEFIQKLIMHIPEPNFKYIRFYGAYHNSTKIYIDLAKMIDEERIKFKRKLNKWRYKILTNFHIDPLICPICREEMIYYKSYYT